MPKIPAYRQRKDRNQALVTLTDAVTKRRRDYWLGPHGSPESYERYHRLIAEWQAQDRRLPADPPPREGGDDLQQLRLSELLLEFHRSATQYYDTGEARSFAVVIRLMRKFYGQSPAAGFGPRKLRLLREQMIAGDASEKPPRKAWSRKYINQQIMRIRRIFKWAAAQELAPPAVHLALCTLEPLKRGRCAARENPRVGPAPEDLVEAVLPLLSKPVRALVELQMLTGARAGELVIMRVCDLEIDDHTKVWTYRPQEHKNAHRERERVIYLGPRAQEVVQPFLAGRSTTDYLFRPTEAEAARRRARHTLRKTRISCGNRPGTNRKAQPAKAPGERYTTNSYRRAIDYACAQAFPPPEPLGQRDDETKKEWRKRLTAQQKVELRDWRREHRWHPHQLRHNAATEVRRAFGLEAAQLALGHASATITDAIYAERDQARVMEIMRKIG